MGITYHELALLKYLTKNQNLGAVLTLGRQSVCLNPHKISRLLTKNREWGDYCELLLIEGLGAQSVTSMDASHFEGATLIHDLNLPLSSPVQYDTLIDFGTTEHIFDLATAFRNITSLVKLGGTICHAVPANNFCGHGFYQFSPEFFFSLYSENNGFKDTEIFVADYGQEKYWWKLTPPRNGVRHSFSFKNGTGLLVRTTKGLDVKGDKPFKVYQSDYKLQWDHHENPSNKPEIMKDSPQNPIQRLKSFIKTIPFIYSPLLRIYLLFKRSNFKQNMSRYSTREAFIGS